MILLRTTKYGENGAMLHTYSLDKGRSSHLVKNCSNKKKYPKGGIHPLSILSLEDKELYPKHNLDKLKANIVKTTLSIFIAEVLYRTLTEDIPDKDLYDFLEKSILTLNNLETNYSNFHIWFLVAYIAKLGFLPDFEKDSFFNEEEISDLRIFINDDLNTVLLHPLTKNKRFSLCSSLIEYIKLSLGYHNMEIKSLNVLHQIFN